MPRVSSRGAQGERMRMHAADPHAALVVVNGEYAKAGLRVEAATEGRRL